jgi:hypothetical protein
MIKKHRYCFFLLKLCMLEVILSMQFDNEGKNGCQIGKAIELTEVDEMFKAKISIFFDLWERKVKDLIDEMQQMAPIKKDTKKQARAIIAM